jgi:hypothetical protein
MEKPMPSGVFISYDRRNRPFADRLHMDLERAGVKVWWDDDIQLGDDFEKVIIPAIADSSHLVVLASPEARDSDWVEREVAEAVKCGKPVVPLLLAGDMDTMPADWRKRNMIEHAVSDYWGSVQKLANRLNAPKPKVTSLVGLLNVQAGTVLDAARELTAEPTILDVAGRRFVQLPVAPSAYGMTWLFAPPEARLQWPESLGVLFNFTSDYPGSRHLESLQHWSGQVGGEPWLIMVEGPVDRRSGKYELKADQPHEWQDSLAACLRVIEGFAKQRLKVGYYINCLMPLAFEMGLRSTMVSGRRRVYHYDSRTNSRSAGYLLAFDGWSCDT